LSDLLIRGEIHDELITKHVITVSEVRMSPDLRLATVYVLPLGGADTEEVLAALERNRRFIRGVVARAVNLKFAPEIRFRKDESFESGERIDRLLDSLKQKP
jgi:ribosome-binding factor A